MFNPTETDKIVDTVHSITTDSESSVFSNGEHATRVKTAIVSLIKTAVGENLVPHVGAARSNASDKVTSKPSPVMMLSGTIPFRYKGGNYHVPVDICFPPRSWETPAVYVVPIAGHSEMNQNLFYSSMQEGRMNYKGMFLDGTTGKICNMPRRTTLNASIVEVSKFFSGEEPPVFCRGTCHPPHPYSRARAPPAPSPVPPISSENDSVDDKDVANSQPKPPVQDQEDDVPPTELMCPLTHELMRCPVLTDDGHVYERNAIETWFKKFSADEKPRSPNTNLELSSRRLIWSFSLKFKCDEYRASQKAKRKSKRKSLEVSSKSVPRNRRRQRTGGR